MDMLGEALLPLMKYVNMPNASEVLVNRFREVIVETADNEKRKYKADRLDKDYFKSLSLMLSNMNDIKGFDLKPILYIPLPGLHRLTLGIGPFVESGITVSIRVGRRQRFTLPQFNATPEQIAIIAAAVREKKNIVVSGGTFTGKTQFINAVLLLLDPDERVISAQDVPELDLEHIDNRVGFQLNQHEMELKVTYNDVISMSTRLRPDRIIVGELTISNAWSLLRLLNNGQGGLMTTVHANSPEMVFSAIARNVQLAGFPLEGVNEFFRENIDMIIQLQRNHYTNTREVADIYFREDPNRSARAA